MIKTAVILSTGDELTSGRVIDTNSAVIAERLSALGIEVAAVLKVGDKKDKLIWALCMARDSGDVVVGTGGLGPTADDLTAEVVAEFLRVELKQDDEIAQSLRQWFKDRGLAWSANTLKQAMFPAGSTIVPNPIGTAPGFAVEMGSHKTLFWLSGVPQEMSAMLEQTVLPWVERHSERRIYAVTFKIHGITEGRLDEVLRPVSLGGAATLSFRAHYPDLSLRLTVRGDRNGAVAFEELCRQIRAILGEHIYAEGDATLEEIVGRLLVEKNQTLALAESCTGGYISHRVTRVAGSSVYYYGGAVTYSNDAKMRFLGVGAGTLEKYGAVSRETALEMSAGIKARTEASVGLSVTGIAGPGGGTPDKRVGTVWVSIAQPGHHDARLFNLGGDRERIILGTSQIALNWLRTRLLGLKQ